MTNPTELFQPFDSFSGNALTNVSAIDGTAGPTTTGESSSYVSICTDTDSVTKALDVSGSLSDGGVDASVSAKADWTSSLSITSTSVVVIVHCVVQTGLTQGMASGLTSQASSALAGSVQSFYKTYGDSWVNQIVTGAEYYAAFIFDSTTVDQQNEIKTQLSGSSGTLSTQLSTTLTKTSSSTKTTLRVSQQMLGASNLSFPNDDPDDMVDFAYNFPSKTFNAPEIIAFSTTGYESVSGVTGFDAVAKNRGLLGDTTFIDASAALEALSSQVKTIQAMYDGYGYTGDSEFATRKAQIKTDLSNLNTLISHITANVAGTYSSLQLPSLKYGTPNASYFVTPPLQTITSTYFSDLTNAQIASGVKPADIVITQAGFEVTYTDDSVVDHVLPGHELGDELNSLTIDKSDSINYLRWINGTYGFGDITTVNGGSVSVGRNAEGFPWTTYTAPLPIIGFSGYYPNGTSGDVELTPLSITISPAIWLKAT